MLVDKHRSFYTQITRNIFKRLRVLKGDFRGSSTRFIRGA